MLKDILMALVSPLSCMSVFILTLATVASSLAALTFITTRNGLASLLGDAGKFLRNDSGMFSKFNCRILGLGPRVCQRDVKTDRTVTMMKKSLRLFQNTQYLSRVQDDVIHLLKVDFVKAFVSLLNFITIILMSWHLLPMLIQINSLT